MEWQSCKNIEHKDSKEMNLGLLFENMVGLSKK